MKKIILIVLLQIILFPDKAFLQNNIYRYSFQDPDFEIEQRIDDLISRLTLEQKAEMMLYNSPAIDSLGIPAYNWWNECLHGVGRAGKATVFPQAIGLAATFDNALIYRIADAISTEARAKYNTAVNKGNRKQYAGLTFWTPNINIFRDPRWGRGQETYGEDPFLTGRMGAAFVKGLQGDNPMILKTAACAKHFAVHSGPEESRHRFNAHPDERDFREIYLPAFKMLVDADVEAVMCAYNRLYDYPCCGSDFLLHDILREEWGFKGHIVSDCWALDDIWARHKVVKTREEAAAMAALAGVNVNCGYIYNYLPEAVHMGLVEEQTINEILRPLLTTRFKLGLFDPKENNPYANLAPGLVNCTDHKKLAYEAAAKSVVLLKNDHQILPLRKDTLKSILITGPTAIDLLSLVGNYNGYSGEMTTILEGIFKSVDAGTIVDYNPGCLYTTQEDFMGFWEARMADVIIVSVGITKMFEGEEGEAMLNETGGDREDIALPANQVEYIKLLRDKIADKPMIVIITGGCAMGISEVVDVADAVLFAWYPGEQGGLAIADILFGDVNPSGRLPVTFYRSVEDLPPFEDYSMAKRTYRYFEGDPLFEFGYGMGYSEFEYSWEKGEEEKGKKEVKPGITGSNKVEEGIFEVNVAVKNIGMYDGEEVVQVYASKQDSHVKRPIKWLVGFGRVALKKGEEIEISLPIEMMQLSYWDIEKQQYIIEPGKYEIQVGSSSADIRLRKEIFVN